MFVGPTICTAICTRNVNLFLLSRLNKVDTSINSKQHLLQGSRTETESERDRGQTEEIERQIVHQTVGRCPMSADGVLALPSL